MRRLLISLAIPAALFAAPALAAEAWGLKDEKLVSFRGQVVDILCALKGDCPAACGGGKRQLGIVSEGKLYAAAKSNTLFAGATKDLLPWCGRTIEIDGLLVENPAMPILMVQGIREKSEQPFAPTDQFEKDWTAANGKADEWWRADPTARAALAENGILGRKDLKWPK
jgi:hypothetical protein